MIIRVSEEGEEETMKFVLAPDSFKGTMSSLQVCAIMKKALREQYPDSEVVQLPIADGGEGSIDCFLEAVGGVKKYVTVSGPFGEPMKGYYGILNGGKKTAIIEMAVCAGLPLVSGRENPETATTYGVGELIKDAVEEGCEKIILGLGGSATNDCGCGMAAALGCVFRDRSGKRFVPAGGSLKEISQIDPSGISRSVLNCDIIAMCDVNNPLYGPMGAAYIYGPQKGADPDMVERLDQGLRHFAGKLPCAGGEKTALLPGAGAAGGMGAGAVAFLRARLMSGIDVVLDMVGFEDKIRNADAVFTGEGKLDKQSMMGKVVGGIARRAEKSHVPVIVLAGCVSEEMTAMENPGIAAAFCINPNPDSYLELKEKSMANLEWTMRNIARLIRAARP